MNIPSRTWKWAILILVLCPVGWLAYRTCPCIIQSDPISDSLRISSQPVNCAVFRLPSDWRRPSGEYIIGVTYPDLMLFELRRSKRAADEFLIGLRFREVEKPNETQYATDKFAFRFHPADGKSIAKVDGVRGVSGEEWVNTQAIPYYEPPDRSVGDFSYEAGYVGFKNHRFPRQEKYPGFYTRRMVSVNEVFFAVPSYGGPDTHHGLSFDPFPDPWWRTMVVDFFRIATGDRIARIRGWTCIGGLGAPNVIEWHADEFFSMPVTRDGREILLCDFRRK